MIHCQAEFVKKFWLNLIATWEISENFFEHHVVAAFEKQNRLKYGEIWNLEQVWLFFNSLLVYPEKLCSTACKKTIAHISEVSPIFCEMLTIDCWNLLHLQCVPEKASTFKMT